MRYYDKIDGYLCDDEMIAVDGGGHGDLGQTGRYELQHGHLSGGVLHRYTVRPQSQVSLASLNLLRLRVVQVRVEHLLRESQGPVQPTSHHHQILGSIHYLDHLYQGCPESNFSFRIRVYTGFSSKFSRTKSSKNIQIYDKAIGPRFIYKTHLN